MLGPGLYGLINILFNIANFILLLLIYRWCMAERTRSDRLETMNHKLTNRFIRFVAKLPIQYRVKVADIDKDEFDTQFPPLEDED